MAGKLSQPGCHINTGTSNRSGRSVVKLDFIPVSNYNHRRTNGRISSAPVMRGSLRKPEKKKLKNGKKFLGRLSSFLQFSSSPVDRASKNKAYDVRLALKKFKSMCSMASSQTSSLEVLAMFKELHPHLAIHSLRVGQGHVPGIEVGALFRCRAELCVVGLHRPPQAGIDWKDVTRDDGHETSIALSIVASGGYEDDLDNGETLIYTGEGGKNGSGQQCEDQSLTSGNTALYNSYLLKNSIRVIRGRPDVCSPYTTLYSYDGLYKVEDWTREPGISKFSVYKFTLVRESGQRPLQWQAPVRSSRRVLRGF